MNVSRSRCYSSCIGRLRLIAPMLAVLACVGAHAAVPRAELVTAKRWAIIIAIDEYPRWPQQTARRAESDGRELAAVLRSQYGYDADQVIELYGANATNKELLRTHSDLRPRVGRGDSVLLVISARYDSSIQGSLLMPYDADPEARWTLIPLAEIQNLLMSTSASAVFTVVEKCPNPFPERADTVASPAQTMPVTLDTDSRRSIDQIAGCSAVGTTDSRTFLGHFVTLLKDWQPGSLGRTLDTQEITARLQKEPSLQIYRSAGTRQASFAFQRQSPGLDPAIEARVKNRSADRDARLTALADLAKTISAAGEPSHRTPAEQLMIEVAGDSTEEAVIRAEAVMYLGRLRISAAQSVLQAQLVNEQVPAPVRVASLEALNQISGGPKPEILSQAMLSSDPSIVRAAVEMASRLPREQAQKLLLGWINPNRPAAALIAALRSLQLIGAPAEATVPRVIPFLESSADTSVRREAIRLLASAGTAQALSPLMKVALRTGEPAAVRQDASYAIGALAIDSEQLRAEAAGTLGKVMTDPDPGIRRAAADSLGRLQVRSSREVLERLLLKDRSGPVREAAALSLGQLGDRAASRALVRALEDSEPTVRRAAALSLGDVGDIEDVERLLPLTRDKNPDVQAAANQALDRLKGSAESTIWSDIVQRSKDSLERVRAIGRLPDMEDPHLTALLIEALGDNSSRVRQAAITKLTRLPGAEVLRQLRSAIADKDDELSSNVAAALGEIGRSTPAGSPKWSEALSILTTVPRDADSDLRVAVARALGAFAGPQVLDALAPYAGSEKTKIRAAAADSFRALGESFYKAGQFENAVKAGDRAVKLRMTLVGELDPELATDLNNLAVYLSATRNDTAAEQLLRRALYIREQAAGRGGNELDTAVSLTNLAAVYETRGDFKSAEALYLRALSIRERALAPDDPLVVQSTEKLVRLYRAMGDQERAAKYAGRSYELQKRQ